MSDQQLMKAYDVASLATEIHRIATNRTHTYAYAEHSVYSSTLLYANADVYAISRKDHVVVLLLPFVSNAGWLADSLMMMMMMLLLTELLYCFC